MCKTFLVTGCTKGIGLAISYHLDTLGYQVVGIARKRPDNNLFKGSLYLADLSDGAETQAILNQIKQECSIDGIVSNVSIVKPQSIQDIQLNDFHNVIDLNFRPAIQALQMFLPLMQAQKWGKVVTITSRALHIIRLKNNSIEVMDILKLN